MLKKDKNRFIDVINANKLDPSHFRHIEKEVDNKPAFILRLENTPLFFMARNETDDFHSFDCRYIQFAPNFPKSEYYPDGTFGNDWMGIDGLLETFANWLKSHVKVYLNEIETPDLWNQIKNSTISNIKFEESDSHKPFNKIEKERIRTALKSFKIELISHYNPSSEEIKIIDEKLSYLSRKLDELNKFDWQAIAISTIISISITLSLDTDKGNALFSMFKKAFDYALNLLT
ncbi:MAG: hypothetical protein V6Z89_06830 [Desulfobacter sp.]